MNLCRSDTFSQDLCFGSLADVDKFLRRAIMPRTWKPGCWERLPMNYRVNVEKSRGGTTATIHAATSQKMRCQPWIMEVTEGEWFGPYVALSGAEHLALSMGVARKNIHRYKIYLKGGNPVQRASIGASTAGMAAGAGSGLMVGDLGAAGLAIGGGAVSIPAVAVPAIVGCGCALCLWKAGKFVTERLHEHCRGNASPSGETLA